MHKTNEMRTRNVSGRAVFRRAFSMALCAGTVAASVTFSACKKGDYVHGKKGYYSQVDNGISTEVRNQGGNGNCWAHAADDSIRTASQIAYGKDIPITVEDIMDVAMGSGKEEGLRIVNAGQEKNAGGQSIYAAWGFAGGYKGYVLDEMIILSGEQMGQYEGEECPLKYNGTTREQIQEVIRNEGAVCVILRYGAGVCTSHGYGTIYDDTFAQEGENPKIPLEYFQHEAVVVGWDDYFPKEYFGAEFGKEPPKENGAWLMKDSGGTNAGNGGYYWVSYESAMIIDMVLRVTDKYSEVIGYDAGAMAGIVSGDMTTAANVYHHEGTLTAVGTYVGIETDMHNNIFFGDKEDTRITIEIRDAAMENVLAVKECEFEYEGYYVVELDEPIEVSDFSIVVTYHAAAPVEGMEPSENHHKLEYVTSIREGESFILVDGQWLDLADPKTSEKLGLDYIPNNACIKALFA